MIVQGVRGRRLWSSSTTAPPSLMPDLRANRKPVIDTRKPFGVSSTQPDRPDAAANSRGPGHGEPRARP